MHMAFDVKAGIFGVTVDARAVSAHDLLRLTGNDRLGIVVDRPYGGMDASLMIFLFGTAFYDEKPKRRRQTIYPDIYLFHSGGPWGSHMPFDFAPDRKEVFVPSGDPAEMLPTINQVGVTHLLVPPREPRPVKHRFKEPEAALDRIRCAWTYGPPGSVADPDTIITVDDFAPLIDTYENTLDAAGFLAKGEALLEQNVRGSKTAGLRVIDTDELARQMAVVRRRLPEVSADDPGHLRFSRKLETARADNRLSEDYRSIDPGLALGML